MNDVPRIPAEPNHPWMGSEPFRLDRDDNGKWVLTLNDGVRHISSVLPENVVDQLAERIATEPVQATGVQAQVTLVAYEFLGESAAYIRKALPYDPDETVASLLTRAHGLGEKYRQMPKDGDRVELQIIPETIPQPPKADNAWPSSGF